jgi:radical SAM superfamily enzyme YgiQ (UPF0313 family)
MKIALLLPPMKLEERYGRNISKMAGTLPPLGLLYLGAALKKTGHIPLIYDGSRIDLKSIISSLKEENPEVIGISTLTFLWPKVKEIIKILKEIFPKSIFIIGGSHASIYGKQALEESDEFDILVYGEGEITIVELIEKIKKRESLTGVNGIIYRQGRDLIINPAREFIKDLDSNVLPARELLNITDYIPAFSQYKRLPVTNMFTTRGCPFNCIFCTPGSLGKKVRYRSAEKVVDEVEVLYHEYGIREIAFWDDTFVLDRKRVLDICNIIINKKLNIIWSAQARVNLVDKELLEAMADAGCWKLHYGVESGVQKTLDSFHKGTRVTDAYNAVKWTKQARIEVETSFVFGAPNETYQDGLKTIKHAIELNPDYARFFLLAPFDSLIAARLKPYGEIITNDFKRFQGYEPTFIPYSMNKKQMQRLFFLSYVKFYTNFRYILKRLAKLNKKGIKDSLLGFRVILSMLKDLLVSNFNR